MRELISWGIRQVRDNLAALALLAGLAAIGWLLGGRGLAGTRRVLWALVPALAVGALVAWAGPGRLFPKIPYEGPILLPLSRNHAVTLLDVLGLACACVAAALGGWLLRERLAARRD